MTRLADIAAKARRERLLMAVEGILRQTDVPLSTAEVVKRVREFLNIEEELAYVAKELQKATAHGHPLRRPTGETFVKYGKTMPRYEWLPSHRKQSGGRDKALDQRRREIEALKRSPPVKEEAADDWTWTPPTDEDGFLED